jgi:hypothetical protein
MQSDQQLTSLGICFSKAQRRLPEDGPEGPKQAGANVEIF